MSGSSYVTLSTTVPLYNILIDHIEDILDKSENEIVEDEEDIEIESDVNTEKEKNEKWSKLIQEASNKCKTKLLEYYNKTNDPYLISIILDPRLKLQYFQDHEWDENSINEIQQKLVIIIYYNIV
jgi:Domain of unknown function (DUF4413)